MGYDLITSGYCSLDKIIKINSNLEIGKTSIISNKSHNRVYYGGCNVNISIDLARLGIQATPIIRVGSDYESTGFKQYLEENAVVTDAVKKLNNEITSSTVLIETNSHEHITLFYPGAMDNLYSEPYNDLWFKNSKCALMTVASLSDNKEFLKQVKKHNLPLFLGMKMDFDSFPKIFLKECLDNVEILFTNESEATFIKNIYELDNFEDLINILPKIRTIIVTKGKNGSTALYKNNQKIIQESVRVIKTDKIVDTVGSGDAYIAGYIYGYLNKKSVRESMEYGSTLASFVIEGTGSTTASPTKEAFLKRYQNHFGREN